MIDVKKTDIPAPPSVIVSLKAGFDAVASNIFVIILPVLLDLLYWLGPRLSLQNIFTKIQPELQQILIEGGRSFGEMPDMMKVYEAMFTQVNLWWALHTTPIGIFSLLAGNSYRNIAGQGDLENMSLNPFGQQLIWQIPDSSDVLSSPFIYSFSMIFLLIILLMVVGWILGGLYFRWVASVVIDESQGQLLNHSRAIVQAVLFSVIWTFVFLAVGIPGLLVLGSILAFNAVVAQVLFFIVAFLSMWVLVPVFFSFHGIFVTRQNALVSIWNGFRMARFTMPNSSLFVISVFLMSFGLNYLWSIPSAASWAALIGILGHAFVVTALLAASFIFYRDSMVWIQVMLDRFKSNPVIGKQDLK